MEQTITFKTVQKVIGLEKIPSTQSLARSLAIQETDGTLILACQQTAAVDRDEKPFFAGEGGVYFTLILNPQFEVTGEKLTWAMTNAISDVIINVLNVKTKISKMGDIFVQDSTSSTWKKCAGILAEKTNDNTWLLGAGIYLNTQLPVSCKNTCVSLSTVINGQTSKELFLDEVLNNFWKEYAFL